MTTGYLAERKTVAQGTDYGMPIQGTTGSPTGTGEFLITPLPAQPGMVGTENAVTELS